MASGGLFEKPAVYLITRGEASAQNFEEASKQILAAIREAVERGVSLIQIREKQLTAKLLFQLVSSAVEIARGSSTKILVNDRADIAAAAGADGVHLTGSSFPPDSVRKVFPRNLLIGVSTHTVAEIENASKSSANFVVFGPVFDTPGKAAVAGIDTLRTVCRVVQPFPVIALGGIDETNCEAVIEAGAAGVAGIRSLNSSTVMSAIVEKLRY